MFTTREPAPLGIAALDAFTRAAARRRFMHMAHQEALLADLLTALRHTAHGLNLDFGLADAEAEAAYRREGATARPPQAGPPAR
jgi:hypothetical protein